MKILVTTGATREYIDPVRFISNDASGRLGVEITRQSNERGHDTCMVHGPLHLAVSDIQIPEEVERVAVLTTAEMSREVRARYDTVDVVFMVAAVADFRPIQYSPGKLKRKSPEQVFKFSRTEDILKGLGADKTHQFLVGFNLETEDPEPEARRKLKEKNLDLIVLNGPENMGSLDATVRVMDIEGITAAWEALSKTEIARRLVMLVEERAGNRDAGR